MLSRSTLKRQQIPKHFVATEDNVNKCNYIYKLGSLTEMRGSASGSSFSSDDWRAVTIFSEEGERRGLRAVLASPRFSTLLWRLKSHFSTSNHCAWGAYSTYLESFNVSRTSLAEAWASLFSSLERSVDFRNGLIYNIRYCLTTESDEAIPCDILHIFLETSWGYRNSEGPSVCQGFQNFAGTDDFIGYLAASQEW